MVDREHFDEWLRERAAAPARRARNRHVRALRARRRTASRSSALPRRGRQARAGERARPRRHRRRRRAIRRWRARRCRRRAATRLRLRLSRDHPQSPRRRPAAIDAHALRCLSTSGTLSPDFYGWIFPHGDTHQHRHRLARTRAFRCAAPSRDLRAAIGPRRLRDHPPRGRADPAQAADALGQWPRRPARRRRGRRRRAGLRRGHLLRHGRRPARGRGGRRLPDDRRCRAPRAGAQAIHEGAWPGLLDPRHHAALLVLATTAGASASSGSARTRTCSSSPGMPT